MTNIEHYFVLLMVAVAIFDRFVLRRKSVLLKGIGRAVSKTEALAFPIMLYVRHSWISDARIEYSLQDLNNPSVVISGKTRGIDAARRGIRQEFLLINSRYLEAGRWDLRVKISNGNCRLNPLYRIFPQSEMLEKQYTISAVEGGGWNVE